MSKSKYRSKRRKKQKGFRDYLTAPLLVVVAGIVLLAGALFALWRSGQPENPKVPVEVRGSPSLKVDRELIDLGDVPLNETVSVSFQLSNVGDKALRFSNKPFVEVAEGCWPPVPTIGAMVLKPGEQTTLSMSFMMHEGMEGMHDFRVQIPNNDPNFGEKELVVLSNWVPWYNKIRGAEWGKLTTVNDDPSPCSELLILFSRFNQFAFNGLGTCAVGK